MDPFLYIADEAGCPSPDIVSVSICDDGMFTAAFGERIFRKDRDGTWTQESRGLPDGVAVNRLQSIDGTVYACTNRGLFYRDGASWYPTEITVPCYQIAKQGGWFAATEYGLWCKAGTNWGNVAYSDTPIYELLLAPQYYILGTAHGISLYDRYAGGTADFPLGTAVTSLAVHQGTLFGVSKEGGLVQGDRRGGFAVTGFEGVSLYSLKTTDAGVFCCASRGLYQLKTIGARTMLRSLLVGYPVTDLIPSEDGMYVATLNWGLKKVGFR